jgi:cytochrome c oxidase assembly protein subunit 15
MVDWRPLTGWLPPHDEAAWQAVFDLYRSYPEYRALGAEMTLGEFKTIFWWEYVHRLWGRLIGVVFAAPLVWFVLRRQVPRALLPRLAGLFALGALQGLVGWWMVTSGLVDEPSVSQYRLAVHLGLAVLIYAALLWTGFDVLWPRHRATRDAGSRTTGHARGLLALVFITILSGALVAGLDAGLSYNTFPLMDGGLLPPGALAVEPVWRNPFDNVALVQFDHRWLAITTVLVALALWLRDRRRPAAQAVLGVALLQAGLGIATLLLLVPVPLAAAHQAGALLLLTATLAYLHDLRRAAATPTP